ncbi:MAG: baseplate J protein, partial [Oscillospiraceae bacterium]|nr:baseplate J protein [Oscillospiraceae bacterium]
MIVLRIEREFKIFLRGFLNNAFVTHAPGTWLDLKVPDYSKKRKKAQKAQGLVTVSRMDAGGDAIRIEKGHVFKTKKDINGEELRFFALKKTILQQGARAVDVPV